jgi:hemoglobin/transferrin/lactoferrin receptor protein
VITATRYPVPVARLPYDVRSARRGGSENIACANVPDLVGTIPGMIVQKTSAGGGAVYLGGLLGNYNLLLVDGVRMNNATLRSGPNQYLNTIDTYSVERIEVWQGPGSVLYGSDAVGGVINVITATPRTNGGAIPRMEAQGQMGGPDGRRGGSLRLMGKMGPIASLVNVSATDYRDLRGGDTTGTQKPTAYGTRSGLVKLSLPPGPGGQITGSYQFCEQENVPRYDRVSVGKDLENVYNPQKRTLYYIRGQRTLSSLGRPAIETTISGQRQDEGRRMVATPKPGKPRIQVREQDLVQTYGAYLQGRWSGNAGRALILGTETYGDRIKSKRLDRNLETGQSQVKRGAFPNGTRYLTSALFARWNGPVADRLALHLGSRLNFFSIRSNLSEPFGRLKQTYAEPTAEIKLMAEGGLGPLPPCYVGTGRAFRAPNASDLTAVGTFNAGIEVPNPALRPERGWTYDLGVKSFSSILSYQSRIYLSELTDLIIREPGVYQGSDSLDGQPVFVRRNVGRGRIWGWDGFLSRALAKGFRVSTDIAYTWGQNLTDHSPLQRIPPLHGRLTVGRRWAKHRLDLAATAEWARSQRRLSPADRLDSRIPPGGTAGFLVCGSRLSVQPRPWIALGLSLENLANVDYRIHGSGVNGGGRSAAVEISLSNLLE